MTSSSAQDRITTLVLAGTGEARLVIDELRTDGRFAITASLAGATDAPASLGVPCISGGFGGADGLAAWCRTNGVQLIIDMTHPYAATMSANAALAAGRLGIANIRHDRPPWHMKPGDNWRRVCGLAGDGAGHSARSERVSCRRQQCDCTFCGARRHWACCARP